MSKERELLLLRERERRKCEKGFSGFKYFLERYCYIQDKEKQMPSLFKLWPAQVRILPDLFEALLLIILKARQLGLTWLCAAYSLWVVMFQPMKLVVVISAKGDWAVEFLDRTYFMLQRLPSWIYPKIIKDTTEVLTFHHPDGDSTIKSLTTTEAGAQSKTPDVLILDETCWNPYIREIFNASKPGIEAAGGRIIIISNSIKTAPGWAWTRDIFINAMRKLNDFVRIFMPWQDRPGRPVDFIERQIQGGMDPEDASEHYPATEEEAITVAGGSYFGKTLARHSDTMEGVKGHLKEDRGEYDFITGGERPILEIWRFPYFLVDGWDNCPWTSRYCMGSDVSEGLGQSYSVAYVYDRLFHEFVARLRSNRIDAYTWANMLHELSLYYENALMCVERTGAGQTTVKRLSELDANQYIQLISDKVGSQVSQKFGWHESNQSKHELCGDLKNWFKETDGTVYCPVLIDEASTFIRHENGKLDPEEGKFSDCVMAAGCAIQADIFIGESPKKIVEEPEGWLNKWQQGRL